jgi:hypothetical protein
MRATFSPTTGGVWFLAAVLATTACHSSKSRSAGLERQLQEIALTTERDSLLREVADNGKLLSDLEAELAKVQLKPAKGTAESPALEVTTDQRAYVLEQVKSVATRLQDAEKRLVTSERRVGRLAQKADSLGEGLTQAKSAIADLGQIVATQRTTIEGLNAQVEALTGQIMTLSDSVLHLTDDHNTAFYVVGTRAELVKKGVLVEEGHRAIPLVGRRGVQPARELPLEEFTSIDRNSIREIPLPRTDRKYRIVSRQNLAYLTGWDGSRGQVSGTIGIQSPEEFWEPSRYLIVVEQ